MAAVSGQPLGLGVAADPEDMAPGARRDGDGRRGGLQQVRRLLPLRDVAPDEDGVVLEIMTSMRLSKPQESILELKVTDRLVVRPPSCVSVSLVPRRGRLNLNSTLTSALGSQASTR